MRAPLLLAAASLVAAMPPPLRSRDDDRTSLDLSKCPGYAASNVVITDSSLTADLKINGPKCNTYSVDLEELKLVVEHQTDDRLHVKIYDAGLNMYQVQESVFPRPKNNNSPSSGAALRFDLVEEPFSFTVTRNENEEVLFDTSAAQLVYQSQYLRLRTKLPQNPNLYGLGEHSDSFRLSTKDYTRTLYNIDSPAIPTTSNLYGSHPVYFDHRGDNGTHGVFLLNANGMDIKIDRGSNGQYLEYNTIGGVFDFYFMAGKKPADVSKQYADIVGYSAMYPYWSLGFHQCKYGYWDVNMVAEVVANYSNAGIPLEVMWTDIDYMDRRRDFTLDPLRFPLTKMRELVTTLHERGQRYILILDPAIPTVVDETEYTSYNRGKDLDIFLKSEDFSGDFLGVQWAGVQAWPDWFHPKAEQWWSNEFEHFFSPDTGVDIDGIWVDMNEAANFCSDIHCDPIKHSVGIPPVPKFGPRPNTGRPIDGFPDSFQPSSDNAKARRDDSICPRKSDFGQMKGTIERNALEPKYKVEIRGNGHLSDHTIYTSITNCDGTQHIDTHNLYGHMMALTTHTSMQKRRPDLRPLVVTRSSFAGTGSKAAHWFGDNMSSWEHYRTSIRQMLSWVSMHQMPMVGSDVCGFNGNADPYLCARWALIGAFQPFYRNHAADNAIFQEFYRWPQTIAAAKKAIDTRYKLLDYAYTALYYQTTDGVPMINPLFFLYPSDSATFGIQDQWFYGDALLISPVTTDFSDTVTFYLPNDRFYDYWTHETVEGKGQNKTLHDVGFSDIPIHIRGGSIVPERARSANTTTLLRKEGFVVTVAPGRDGKASGRLYLDDGESLVQDAVSEIAFEWDGRTFSAKGTFGYGGEEHGFRLDKIVLLGQREAQTVGAWSGERKEIVIDGPGLLTREWKISFEG